MVRFDKRIERQYAKLDSFVSYMCLEGDFIIEFEGDKTTVSKGDTVMIPASIDELTLIPSGEVTLLEVYIA